VGRRSVNQSVNPSFFSQNINFVTVGNVDTGRGTPRLRLPLVWSQDRIRLRRHESPWQRNNLVALRHWHRPTHLRAGAGTVWVALTPPTRAGTWAPLLHRYAYRCKLALFWDTDDLTCVVWWGLLLCVSMGLFSPHERLVFWINAALRITTCESEFWWVNS